MLAESRIQPVVLILDDLHWADAASLLLVDFLLRRMPAGALAIIGAYRDTARTGLPVPVTAPVLRLGGLGVDAVAGLVARTSGREIDPAAAAELRGRTGGNPFFVQQVAWLPPAEAVPPGVGAVLAERFADLPPATVDTLGAAAAIASVIRPAVLAAVTGQTSQAVADALAPARARILVADQSGRAEEAGRADQAFAHDLLREYAYEQVSVADRPGLHRRIAEALETLRREGGEVEPAEIAEHHVAADPASALAYEWSVAAARDASRRLAYEQAVRHWQHAVAGSGEHRSATLLELAEAARRAGDPSLATRTYERAAELARRDGDGDGLGRVALGMHAVGRRTFRRQRDLVVRHDGALSHDGAIGAAAAPDGQPGPGAGLARCRPGPGPVLAEAESQPPGSTEPAAPDRADPRARGRRPTDRGPATRALLEPTQPRTRRGRGTTHRGPGNAGRVSAGPAPRLRRAGRHPGRVGGPLC